MKELGLDAKEKSSAKTKKSSCGPCGGIRNCEILGEHKQSSRDEYFDWYKEWKVLRCCGCDHIFVETIYTDSESYNSYIDENDEEQIVYDETVKYWPALSKRRKPAWLAHISGKNDERDALNDSLNELYGALEGDLHTLAAIGIRTCFDIAAELLEIDPEHTFSRKLDELVQAGHIAALDRSRLETLVEAGSASAHRGWRPAAEDVETMTDALEHFIHAAFVAPEEKKALDAKIATMKSKVPKRPTSKKKASSAAVPSLQSRTPIARKANPKP